MSEPNQIWLIAGSHRDHGLLFRPSIGFLMDLGLGTDVTRATCRKIGNMRPAQDVDLCTSGVEEPDPQPTLPCRRHHRYGNADHQAPS
jgi:hypothetical protein